MLLLASLAFVANAATKQALDCDGKKALQTLISKSKAARMLNGEGGRRPGPPGHEHQKEVDTAGDRVLAIVDDYAKSFHDLSDEKAQKLMEDYLAAEAARLQVRRNYLPEFTKILPGRTVARFHQIENKMDAVIRCDLAAAIPVVDEKPAPAK